jgi:chromosome segregation ATPase
MEFIQKYQALIVFALNAGLALTGLLFGLWFRDKVRTEVADRASRREVEELDQRTGRVIEGLGAAVRSATERLDSHTNRLDRGESRFERLSEQITQLPTAHTISDLRLTMEHLRTEIRVLAEKVDGMETLQERFERQVNVIDEWLRANARVVK